MPIAPLPIDSTAPAERWSRVAAAILSVLLLSGCPHRAAAPQQHTATTTSTAGATALAFDDIASQAGCRFTYRNGRAAKRYAIVESLGGGGALWDFDLDGQTDIFFPGGGEFVGDRSLRGLPHHLFRGRTGLAWEEITDAAGCGTPTVYSHGVAVADADNDGFLDLLVTGYGGLQFWRNQGDGTFVAGETAAGLIDPHWSSSAGWGDLNGDGALDLYVAHYVDWSFDNDPHCPSSGPDHRDVCPPRDFRGLTDVAFFSNGDGTFRDVSREIGIVPEGKGLGVLLADFDHDGDLDVYVANDTTENFLYQNDGRGQLTELGMASGTALDDRGTPNGSMGLALGDFDGDGRPDLWVTNFELESFALYRNLGGGQFQHISRDAGVTAIGNVYVGFGTVAEDLDLDGDEDLVALNGHVVYYPPNNEESEPPVVLENLGAARFRRVTPGPNDGYFQHQHLGRGLAAGDFDGDGRVDLLAVHTNQPAGLLHNTSQVTGRGYALRLVGRTSNRDAIGAHVVLHATRGDQLRHRYGGGSYLSHSDLTLRWGVAAGVEVRGATITWPGGATQEIPAWPAGKTLVVSEQGGTALISTGDPSNSH